MRKKRFTEKQMVGILRAAETLTLEAAARQHWRLGAIPLSLEAAVWTNGDR